MAISEREVTQYLNDRITFSPYSLIMSAIEQGNGRRYNASDMAEHICTHLNHFMQSNEAVITSTKDTPFEKLRFSKECK